MSDTTSQEGERERGRDRRGSARRRREDARRALLAAAVERASEGPFHDLTVERIVAGVGISRSAFYLHFRDKGDLLLAAVAEAATELERALDGWWRRHGPPAERVRGAVEGLVSAYADQVEVLTVATEVATYDEDVRAACAGIVERFVSAAADRIQADQRAGLIAAGVGARSTAEALVWMVERCCYVQLGLGGRSAEELARALVPVWTAALYPGVVTAEELRPRDARAPVEP
jgi:AcrR family transcriptional regulator